jgi:hypothetical protein
MHSLEKAMADVYFPVYGLPQPIHDLQYKGTSKGKGIVTSHARIGGQELYGPFFTIKYESDRYKQKLLNVQKEKIPEERFIWYSCSLISMKGSQADCKMPTGHRVVPFMGELMGSERGPLTPGRNPLKDTEPITFEGQEIIIDRTRFIGFVEHYSTPLFYTFALFGSATACLGAHFYGPEVEEVFEILQALRVLNGKVVE